MIEYTSKGSYAVMTLLLFTRTRGGPGLGNAEQQQQHQQRYNPAIPSPLWYLAPLQEIVLRQIILESVIPSPFDIRTIHKRPSDASFYGAPVASTYSNDDANVVLSHGNVYRLLNGHWMLCEDGCVDCEPCATSENPSFKWILRRVKQTSVSDPTKHDFQLTIMSQTNDHFRTNNFWPSSYIYATPRERSSVSVTKTQHDNGTENSPSNLENNFSRQYHRSNDPLRLTERDSISQEKNHVRGNASIDKPLEQKHRFRNMRHRPRPVEKVAEEANQLAPKLILGIDQRGQKHLIHVIPADDRPIDVASFLTTNHSIPSHFAMEQATRSNDTISERQTYQRIFRRVFDSLNTYRRSIENFLELPANNISEQRISSSANNDLNRKSTNFESLHFNDTLLSPFYVENEGKTGKYRQHKNIYQRVKPDVYNYYIGHADQNQARISRRQLPMNLHFDGERRKGHLKPFSMDDKNISLTNSSILLQSSSVDAVPRFDFNNDFVINSAKHIDLNETFVDKANNDSIKSSSIAIKRENERVFNSRRLASGDANREFEILHHAFRIITTESPVIRRRHETLDRTAALRINTPKIFPDNQ